MGFKFNDRCLEKVSADEPIFVLRAQDQSAPGLIRKWVEYNFESLDEEHINEAMRCAEEMEAWPYRRAPT